MQLVHLKKSDPSVRRILAAACPGWTGTAVQAIVADTVRFYGTQWDSGYRRTYTLVRLADLQTMTVAEAPFLQRSAGHEAYHDIPPGFVVVVVVDCTIPHVEIIGPAVNINAMLPAPLELTDDERIVLVATRCVKSTYAGIKNYRFKEAARSRGITLDRWEAAKAALIGRGLLNKAGAITTDGKNAVGGDRL